MFDLLRNIWRDESGASVLEYGLIAGLLSLAVLVSLQNIGLSLGGFLGFTSFSLDSVVFG